MKNPECGILSDDPEGSKAEESHNAFPSGEGGPPPKAVVDEVMGSFAHSG